MCIWGDAGIRHYLGGGLNVTFDDNINHFFGLGEVFRSPPYGMECAGRMSDAGRVSRGTEELRFWVATSRRSWIHEAGRAWSM